MEQNDYIRLDRYSFRVIRKYIIRKTKKHVASCCGIDPHTYAKAEAIKSVSSNTLDKIFTYFCQSLYALGWTKAKLAKREGGIPCLILTR